MVNYSDVKNRCTKGRFFPYEGWRDKLFVPPSIFLVWVFVNLGWSGNAVSWLSGLVTIIGAMLIASNDKILILIGACSYMLYYLLDYVDGGVARFNNKGGIEGQYIDWIMHSISAISISVGIFIGALNNTHSMWIIPLGILFVLASSLQLDRFSLGWWALCMYRMQNMASGEEIGNTDTTLKDGTKISIRSYLWKILRVIATFIFHENFAIFLLPILAVLNIFVTEGVLPDFRFVLTILGGTFYFCYVVLDIHFSSRGRKISKAYNKMFHSTEDINPSADLFFL